MNFNVRDGAIYTAQKVVIYGPEGIGKTTLARKFPDPVFIDTEESSKGYAVKRITRPDGGVRPNSWTMLMEMVKAVRDGAIPCKTLVIDSMDWAEAMCTDHICAKMKWAGIEEPGYGKGYTYLEEEFGKLLNLLSEVVGCGVHVVCTAHAAMRRVELPEETGSYDHWELKLERKTAALTKEWADLVLFCNYKTIVTKGSNGMEKNKASGGKRMMYTTHTPWWDAKNRHSLPDELTLEYNGISHLFFDANDAERAASPKTDSASSPSLVSEVSEPPAQNTKPETQPPIKTEPDVPFYDSSDIGGDVPEQFLDKTAPPDGVPQALWDLMQADGVTVEQVQAAVSKKGYYPAGTPIKNYDPQFISGCLVAAWTQVKSMIA